MSRTEGRYRLQAIFEGRRAAREALRSIDRADLGVTTSLDRPEDERAALRGEMRDEIEGAIAGVGNVGPFTKAMSRGMAFWVPVLAVVGAFLGLLLLLLPWGTGMTFVGRLIASVVIGAVAGSTAGFVLGGWLQPRGEGEGGALETEEGVTLGVHADTPNQISAAERILEEHAPVRLYRVGQAGEPKEASDPRRTRPVRGD